MQRLVLLGFSLGAHDLDPFTALEECYLDRQDGSEAAVAAAPKRAA